MPESCFHECPHCGKSWSHGHSGGHLDPFPISCKECRKKHPVDVVAPLMKTQRRDEDEDATDMAGAIVEEIARLLPDKKLREIELMDEETYKSN